VYWHDGQIIEYLVGSTLNILNMEYVRFILDPLLLLILLEAFVFLVIRQQLVLSM